MLKKYFFRLFIALLALGNSQAALPSPPGLHAIQPTPLTPITDGQSLSTVFAQPQLDLSKSVFFEADLRNSGSLDLIVITSGLSLDYESSDCLQGGVYSVAEGNLRLLFPIDGSFSFVDDLRTIDLNGDDTMDLIYRTGTNGNCAFCTWHVAIIWDGKRFVESKFNYIKDIFDFEKDGYLEIESSGELPELMDCSFECQSPMVTIRNLAYAPSAVLRLDSNHYVDSSSTYPAFYSAIRIPRLTQIRMDRLRILLEGTATGEEEYQLQCWDKCFRLVLDRAYGLAGLK